MSNDTSSKVKFDNFVESVITSSKVKFDHFVKSGSLRRKPLRRKHERKSIDQLYSFRRSEIWRSDLFLSVPFDDGFTFDQFFNFSNGLLGWK